MAKSPNPKIISTTNNRRRSLPEDEGKGTQPATSAQIRPSPLTKSAVVIAALSGKDGATLDDVCEATGWQPHSARAFLSGLRKKGHSIAKTSRDDVTCYHIAAGNDGDQS